MNPNRTVNVLIGMVLFMGVLVVLLGGLSGYLLFRSPLGDSLGLATQTPTSAPVDAEPVPAPSPTPESPVVEVVTETVPAGTCNNTGTQTILFTGIDSSTGVWPHGADAVRLVKVDYDQQQVDVIEFPRDLWVNTAGLADQNMPETRLGLAYYYKYGVTSGSVEHRVTTSTTLVAQALYDTFGVAPQSYITLQMDSMAGMIDTIGGVEVNNPQAFTSEYGVKFPAGEQMLDGVRAKEYVRTFVQGGETRYQRQNEFVKGLQNRVMSPSILASVPNLINQFSSAITTDLSPKQLTDLACMAQAVPQEQIHFYEIDSSMVSARSDGALVPNIGMIKAKLQEWLGE